MSEIPQSDIGLQHEECLSMKKPPPFQGKRLRIIKDEINLPNLRLTAAVNGANPADIAIGIDFGCELARPCMELQRPFHLNSKGIDFVLNFFVHHNVKLIHESTPNEMNRPSL